MQKILKWFALALMVGVAIFVVFFLVSINSDDGFVESKPLVYNDDVQQKKQEKDWLVHFSKTKKLGYFYPVNEVYVKIDLSEKINKTITYKLSTPKIDPYQLFCLKTELKNSGFKYFLDKNGKGVDLFIFSRDEKKLNALIEVLKNYKISVVSISKEEI